MPRDDGGVLQFDLPVAAAVGGLTGPATGIERLSPRTSDSSHWTLLDTPDHRLSGWGVELGHDAERSRWTLTAPNWQSSLPPEQSWPGGADVPAAVASLLAPFVRGAALVPIVTVHGTTRTFDLLGTDGEQIGSLTDHSVTVDGTDPRGLRWVRITVPTLLGDQLAFVDNAFTAAGGAREPVAGLAARLGLVRHLPAGRRLTAAADIEDFVRDQFRSRWRRLLQAELAVRQPTVGSTPPAQGLLALRRDLAGLAPLLEPAWVAAAVRVVDQAARDHDAGRADAGWVAVADLLDQASAAPALNVRVQGRRAGDALALALHTSVRRLRDQCRTLEVHSDDERWLRARQMADASIRLSALSRDVFGKPAKALRRQLEPVAKALVGTARSEPGQPSVESLTPQEAFHAGRAYERSLLAAAEARAAFVRSWPQLWADLRVRVIKPRPAAAAESEAQ